MDGVTSTTANTLHPPAQLASLQSLGMNFSQAPVIPEAELREMHHDSALEEPEQVHTGGTSFTPPSVPDPRTLNATVPDFVPTGPTPAPVVPGMDLGGAPRPASLDGDA